MPLILKILFQGDNNASLFITSFQAKSCALRFFKKIKATNQFVSFRLSPPMSNSEQFSSLRRRFSYNLKKQVGLSYNVQTSYRKRLLTSHILYRMRVQLYLASIYWYLFGCQPKYWLDFPIFSFLFIKLLRLVFE